MSTINTHKIHEGSEPTVIVQGIDINRIVEDEERAIASNNEDIPSQHRRWEDVIEKAKEKECDKRACKGNDERSKDCSDCG
jgi:hypothetical protein